MGAPAYIKVPFRLAFDEVQQAMRKLPRIGPIPLKVKKTNLSSPYLLNAFLPQFDVPPFLQSRKTSVPIIL